MPTILVRFKPRLVSVMIDGVYGGHSFDFQAINTICQLEALYEFWGFNIHSLKPILDLTYDIDRLREQSCASFRQNAT